MTKQSAWFASINGTPPTFGVTAITSPDTVPIGSGATGKKMSGILAVGGTLYAWMRNANGNGQQCQLWSSANRGVNWTKHFVFAEFGYLTFINFGKNYAGARDDYVYAVTPNGASAYVNTDDFVLLRVPKAQIASQAAWQVLSGYNVNGDPTWSSTLSARISIFHNLGKCLRSGITYNAGLQRYLWWQSHFDPSGDVRYAGGFGIYEAPEPWGPWRTVYYTAAWDVGPGETGHFPTKWMSADGKTLYLIFSGDDALSVRQAVLTATAGGDTGSSGGSVESRVALGSDDAEESIGGEVRLNSADLKLGDGAVSYVGLRFQDVDVPAGADIISADIELTGALADTTSTSITITGELAEAPATFAVSPANISGRADTTASVSWPNIVSWVVGGKYRTPDLSDIVQELVDQAGWVSGSGMSFLLAATGKRVAQAFDGTPTNAAVLRIDYATGVTVTSSLRVATVVRPRAKILIDDESIIYGAAGVATVNGLPGSIRLNVSLVGSVKVCTATPLAGDITTGADLGGLLIAGAPGGGVLVEDVDPA